MNVSQIQDICGTWPTPLYVYDSAEFARNFDRLTAAYRRHYPQFCIAYSFKTNYTPAICRDVLELGGLAEVVSGMEYRHAKNIGFQPQQIIVNGPAKWGELPTMLAEGALVMLDNMAELERAIECTAALDRPGRIGFRLNFPIEGGKNSRFGFDAESRQTADAVVLARQAKNLRIEGIHFHLSGARSLVAWELRAEKMIGYAETLLLPHERKIIDLGSGMFGNMEPCFAQQFGQTIPTFEDYGTGVAGTFARHYAAVPEDQRPTLIVEPGTTLVANTLSYLTRVLAVKTIRQRNIAIVDGSVHQAGELSKKKRLPLSVISCHGQGQRLAPVEITGYTCLEDDILYPDCATPVGAGDIIHIRNVGSYSNVLAPPFIQEGCGMIELDENGNMRLIKKPQSAEELFSTYIFD